MSPEQVAVAIGVFIIAVTLIRMIASKLPKKLKISQFVRKWREIQKMCKKKSNWPLAVIAADELLDKALIKKRISGKSMGERLVSAQKDFTSNETVWGAHKLANNLRENDGQEIKEARVKNALVAFRTALRDLGAL